MKKKVILLLIFCSFVSYCFAQNNKFGEKKPVSDVTGKIGLSIRISNISPDLDSYKNRDLDGDDELMWGVSLIYGINRWMSCELAFDTSSDIEIKDKTYNVKLTDLDLYPLTLSFKFKYISTSPDIYQWMVPYVIVGAGYYFANGDADSEYKSYHTPNKVSLDIDGDFGWHAGGGIDFFINKNIALGIEGRYFNTSISIEEKQHNPILNINTSSDKDVDIDGWIFGANIKYFFR